MPTSNPVVYKNGVEYSLPTHVQFVIDMTAAGIPVELRNTHIGSGPSVRVSDYRGVTKMTNVGLDWESDGSGYIVYPYRLDPNLAKQQKTSWGR